MNDCRSRPLWSSLLFLCTLAMGFNSATLIAGDFDMVKIYVEDEPIEEVFSYVEPSEIDQLKGYLYAQITEAAPSLARISMDDFGRIFFINIRVIDASKTANNENLRMVSQLSLAMRDKNHTAKTAIGEIIAFEHFALIPSALDPTEVPTLDPAQQTGNSPYRATQAVPQRKIFRIETKFIQLAEINKNQYIDLMRLHRYFAIHKYNFASAIAQMMPAIQKGIVSALINELRLAAFAEKLKISDAQVVTLLKKKYPELSINLMAAHGSSQQGSATLEQVQIEIDQALAAGRRRSMELTAQLDQLNRDNKTADQTKGTSLREVERLTIEHKRLKTSLRDLHQQALALARQFQSQISQLMSEVYHDGVILNRIDQIQDIQGNPEVPPPLFSELSAVMNRTLNGYLSPLATGAPEHWKQAGLEITPSVTLIQAVPEIIESRNWRFQKVQTLHAVAFRILLTIQSKSGRQQQSRSLELQVRYDGTTKQMALVDHSQQQLTEFLSVLAGDLDNLVRRALGDTVLAQNIQGMAAPFHQFLTQTRVALTSLAELGDAEDQPSVDCENLLTLADRDLAKSSK